MRLRARPSISRGQPNRDELRDALSRRVADWQSRLVSNHRREARAALDQLLNGRAIALWGTAGDWETAEGYERDDRRGKENLEAADCLQFEITLDPAGLLLSLVAGARNQHYLQLWRPAA